VSTPASTIVIEAEDKASRVIEQTARNVDKSVRQIKDVSSKAKSSTQFIGVLARSLGGNAFGAYASELAVMTEKVGRFSEVSKSGTAGAFAFKAGLVGLVATISFGVGKAIGNVIWQTERWTQKLADAAKEADNLNSRISQSGAKRFANELADIKLIPDVEKREAALQRMLRNAGREADTMRQRLESAQVKAEEWRKSWKITGNQKAYFEMAKAEVAEREKALETARQNLVTLREETSERNKQIAIRQRKLELLKEEEAFAKSLSDKNKARAAAAINLEVSTIQKIEERRIAIERGAEAGRAYALEQQGLASEVAMRLAADEAALDLAQKTAEERKAAGEKEIESARQIADLQRSEIERLTLKRVELLKGADAARVLALQQRGLSKEFAERLVAEENAIENVKKQRDEKQEAAKQLAGVQTGVQAVQSRLLTRGQADRGIDKIARFAEKQVKALDELVRQGRRPQRPEPQVNFVQVN